MINNKQASILEGLRQNIINESTLPSDLLKKCSPKVKKFLMDIMDLENGKVTKVSDTKDPRYKDAYMRIYVMPDDYPGSEDFKVQISRNEAGSWRKTPDWQFFDPSKGYITSKTNYYFNAKEIAKSAESIYVISKDEYNDNYASSSDVSTKQYERREAQRVIDPHTLNPNDYNVVLSKNLTAAKVGQKTRELKNKFLADKIVELVEKAGFTCYTNDYYDKNGLYFECNCYADEVKFSIGVDKNKNFVFKTTVSRSNKYFLGIEKTKDAEEILKNLDEVRGTVGDVIRFQKSLEKNSELKKLLSQI